MVIAFKYLRLKKIPQLDKKLLHRYMWVGLNPPRTPMYLESKLPKVRFGGAFLHQKTLIDSEMERGKSDLVSNCGPHMY